MMLKDRRCDLHIHTVLSPCGDRKMLPSMIIEQAKNKKLDLIGITDHNATENIASVRKAAKMHGLQVLSGVEITSQEEVHLLVFFDDADGLQNMQRIVYENLDGNNDEDYFGAQTVVDEFDNAICSNTKLLCGATKLKLKDIVRLVHSFNGIAFASHVDRETFGIMGQLGFIPPDLLLEGLELSWRTPRDKFVAQFPDCEMRPIVSFSDAHLLEDIGKAFTVFSLMEMNVNEIKKALADGRYFIAYS